MDENQVYSEVNSDLPTPPVHSWWETFGDEEEEDTLLDYFLGGEQVGADSNSSSSSILQGRQVGGIDFPGYSSAQHQSQFSSMSSSDPLQETHNQVQSYLPENNVTTPATPAVQFYANTSSKKRRSRSDLESCAEVDADVQQQAKSAMSNSRSKSISFQQAFMNYPAPAMYPVSNSSSCSSLSLQGIDSGPILQVQHQFQAQASGCTGYNTATTSPMSPAGMCTNEVLMLPSARRYGTSTSGVHGAANVSQTSDPSINVTTMHSHPQWQSHSSCGANGNGNANGNISTSTSVSNAAPSANNSNAPIPIWVQHMNNVAMIANRDGSMAAPAPVARNQNQTILPNPNTFIANGNQQQYQTLGMRVFPGSDILPVPQNIDPVQHMHHMLFNDDPATESKEKRAKRLARNRESARQSRRRKKDLLFHLQGKVNKLHEEIDHVRRKKLECMEEELAADRIRILNSIFVDRIQNGQSAVAVDNLIGTVRKSGPNVAERKAAINFQYKALQKAILPHYSQTILSLALRDPSFLTEAKEEKIREMQAQKTSGRVGSKLVGEELVQRHLEDGKDNCPGKTNLTCRSNDKAVCWPLLCHELSIGIDLEEKIVHVLEELQKDPQVKQRRAQIFAATAVIASIKENLLAHSLSVANQNETALLQILTPSQTARFLEWQMSNRVRCSKLLFGGKHESNKGCTQLPKANSEHSLSDFCRQLTDTMSIEIERSDA